MSSVSSLPIISSDLSMPRSAVESLRAYGDEKETILTNLTGVSPDNLKFWLNENYFELFFPFDRQLFNSLPSWQTAKNVLQIGSKNGCYLHQLACAFPGRNYVGIEENELLCKEAQTRFVQDSVCFLHKHAEDERVVAAFAGRCDIVILHELLQTLKDPEEALCIASRYLRHGGVLVVMDHCEAVRQSSHSKPKFDEVIAQYESQKKQGGCHVDLICAQIPRWMKDQEHWMAQSFELYPLKSVDAPYPVPEGSIVFHEPKERKLYFQYYLMFLELLKTAPWHFSIDTAALYDELSFLIDGEPAWACSDRCNLVLVKK